MANKTATTSVPPDPFLPGQPVVISTKHPLYAGMSAVITQRPSPDAAIVELSSGERERVPLYYLSLPCQHQFAPVWTTSNTLQERCSLCGQTQPPSIDSLLAALKSCTAAREESAAVATKGKRQQELLAAAQQRQAQIQWLQGQLAASDQTSSQNANRLVATAVGGSANNSNLGGEMVEARLDVVAPDNQPPVAVTLVPPEVVEQLTPEEEQDLHYLERKVERAFVEAGKALEEIRARQLYRGTHKTFEAYCKDRFGFARRHPYRLIAAAAVVENLTTNGTQNDEVEKCVPMGHKFSRHQNDKLGT